MRKIIFTALFSLCVFLGSVTAALAQGTLIHYWHFNNFTTAMFTPTIVGIDADFSIHDTSKAKILYAEVPGTSASYSTYVDGYATSAADYDTVNARMGQPPGTALRPRNPADSMYLLFYIPTVNYKNILLKYGTETSSVGHGDTYQDFDYSTDSGVTWRTSGLSELHDSAWGVFKLVSVSLTDPLVNNNPRLVFRITYNGNTTLVDGNNRFDNVTVEGDSIIIVPTITTTPTAFGPYCNAATSLITVPYTTVGAFTGSFSVQLSNGSGSFASGTSIIGSGTSSPITAAIPAGTTAGTYRLRVINTTGTTVDGSDNGFDIIVSGPPVAYSVTGGGTACAGSAGVAIGVANSQAGASYQLYKAGVAVGSAVIGTGSAISFGSINVAGTYIVRGTFAGSAACTNTMTGSAVVTVSPAPAAITGTFTVCAGQTITLHDATTGGAWSSSDITRASVAGSTGVVTGVATGAPTITFTAAGCTATAVVTVNALSPITGAANICVGSTTILSDAVTGGTWSVNNANASIGVSSGVVTGVTSGSTSVITYTTPAGCLATTTISMNLSPSAIGGPTALCASATINLTNTATGGTWVSATPSVATIGAVSGIVSGVATGTTSITYTLAGGCAASLTVTVSLSPGPVSGPSTVCSGIPTLFSDGVPSGLWSSGSTAIATAGSLSGLVTGVSMGTATITYSLGGTSCTVTKTISVNPSPVAITGTTSICDGATAALSDLSGGGTWSSSAPTIVAVSGTGGITGAGVGTSVISYTLAGCTAITTVTVNTTPLAISGSSGVCVGSTIGLADATTGGIWGSASPAIMLNATGSVLGVSAGTALVTYAIGACSVTKVITVNPVATLTGPTGVCVGSTATLLPSVTGGTWVSAPAAMATVTGSGVVSGVTPGTATITYTLPTGCITTTTIIVNTLPTAITGTRQVCAGATTTLGDGAAGGTWSIAPAAIATAGLFSGVITGISAGTAAITYSLGTGCTVFATLTVNPLPLPEGGTAQVCAGLTTRLTDGTAGGTWSIANTTIATIDATGTVSGITAGTDSVRYTIATGCASVVVVTENPLPSAITVSGYVCLGLNTPFSDISGSGTWSSSNTALATIDSFSGVVTGIGAGAPVITYTLPTTCIATLAVTVNSVAPPVTGLQHVCAGLTTALRDPLPSGIWSVSDPSIATVNSAGLVTGVSAGSVIISYVTAICPATAIVTVNPVPGPISGAATVCAGSSTILTDGGSGTWSSSRSFIADVDPATGIATGESAGTTTIIYTVDAGCTASISVTVLPLPAPIAGAGYVCLGAALSLGETTTGGTWTSTDLTTAPVNTSGVVTGLSAGTITISYTIASGCASTRAIEVISVPAITGVSSICAWGDTLTVHDATPGGSWTSAEVSISLSGLVTSGAPGAGTITYTLPSGCSNTASITVKPLPGPVTGNPELCTGLTTALSDTTTGGAWGSSNLAAAAVGAGGIVTGAAPGISVISYTAATTGCATTATVTVNALPSAIGGTFLICAGTATTLADATGGGTWSSSNHAVASVDVATGFITGVSAGVAAITYNLGASCTVTTTVTVEPQPTIYTVTGGGGYCTGGAGVHVGLSESFGGINYQLYNGATPAGSPVAGDYSNIDFGLLTAPGSYFVTATDTVTSCSITMAGGAVITINPLPALYTVTGGGSYCIGGAGAPVGLGASDAGVNYQLYDGTTPAGGPRAGTGAGLNFGLQTAVGTYAVIATGAVTGCIAHMPDSVSITATPLVTPSVSITSSPGTVLCAGTVATFSTTVTNGGATPGYEWKVNGTGVSATGPSYTYTPANGDIVKAVLISSAACASPDTVSNTVTMTVQPEVAPTVAITAQPGTSIAPGEYDTLTATVINGGTSPVYQWKVNGVVITSATTATYISNTFSNGDTVSCTITSSGACAGQTASSGITITVGNNTGIQQIAAGDNIRVSPNPNKGEFTITGTFDGMPNTGGSEAISLKLTNMLGQVIYKDAVTVLNGEINKRITLDNSVANGMYILNLKSGTGTKAFHIVIEQ